MNWNSHVIPIHSCNYRNYLETARRIVPTGKQSREKVPRTELLITPQTWRSLPRGIGNGVLKSPEGTRAAPALPPQGLPEKLLQYPPCCTPVLVCKLSSCSPRKVFPSLKKRLFLKMCFSVKIRKFPSSFPPVCKKYYSQKVVVYRVWFWIYALTIMLSHLLKACLLGQAYWFSLFC